MQAPSVALVLVSALPVLYASHVQAQDREREPSPDGTRYAVVYPGHKLERGDESTARLEVFTRDGRRVTVAYMWVTEPDGTGRERVRGCERWGWIDNSRVFCEGTINPSTTFHRAFDAKTGRELREAGGSQFVWSPDGSKLANHGNVPHGDYGRSSDFLEIDNTEVYPRRRVTDTLWFRSRPVWSDDSKWVAGVAHRQMSNTVWLVVVSPRGRATTYQLPWDVAREEWPPQIDFAIACEGSRVTVRHAGREHTFDTGLR